MLEIPSERIAAAIVALLAAALVAFTLTVSWDQELAPCGQSKPFGIPCAETPAPG